MAELQSPASPCSWPWPVPAPHWCEFLVDVVRDWHSAQAPGNTFQPLQSYTGSCTSHSVKTHTQTLALQHARTARRVAQCPINNGAPMPGPRHVVSDHTREPSVALCFVAHRCQSRCLTATAGLQTSSSLSQVTPDSHLNQSVDQSINQ